MTIIRDGKTIELTDFELYQATREYERNCYSEDVMNYLAEKYGQDAVFSDEEIEIMVDEMAEAHSMVEENNAEYLYDTFEDIIRRDNAREADELAGTTYTCRPGYYEYNVYDNYSGVIVYNINDPGEMVMDWKTKDDIIAFAEECYDNIERQAEEGGYKVDAVDKEAFVKCVVDAMEAQYGTELEQEQSKKTKSRGM